MEKGLSVIFLVLVLFSSGCTGFSEGNSGSSGDLSEGFGSFVSLDMDSLSGTYGSDYSHYIYDAEQNISVLCTVSEKMILEGSGDGKFIVRDLCSSEVSEYNLEWEYPISINVKKYGDTDNSYEEIYGLSVCMDGESFFYHVDINTKTLTGISAEGIFMDKKFGRI
ncbi:hypothetical protein F1737_06880 [Methanoplanus sp. FWC-SCC4]|uniref:Lipoprotein n=1 Tax=Methanochimaera problematica TaxID=2609417 RepID=A0AA97FDX2_9EURY|nr:hypothetical protein [Methanoplanus sp. FWC-SCC4]WOF16444.1 hypothetical protein F1737_06880 [Methanoplanus sp. FWC-SCC4]